MLDNAYVRITNNFAHDMATGTWAACLLVLWVLDDRSRGVPAEATAALGDAAALVFALLAIALAVITLTGMFRLFYWRAQTPAEERGPKRRALVIKHVAFLVIYVGGTWWAWLLAQI